VRYFGLDLLLQIVGGVLRLPQPVDESEGIDERSIGSQRLLGCALELVLLDEMPVVRRCTLLQDIGEG
jgi:hypothetical protein